LDPNPKDFASWATGINHYGQIVGYASNSQTNYAFLFQGGSLKNLGSLSGPTGVSMGFGINDSGQIVGTSTLANGSYVPFLYRNGIVTQLGSTSGSLAEALAINNLGQIVGIGVTQSGAFLYQNGSFIDLGTLGGSGGTFSSSQALAINNLGQIVGFSHLASGRTHAFLYANGVMKDLGGNRSTGFGINDKSEVVGQDIDENGLPFAFLYTKKAGLVNLNNYVVNLSNGTTTGFTSVAYASSINTQGDIAGLGNYFNGTTTIQAGILLIKK
jgi:probable HAF family extracellular repeat protein